MFGTLISSPAFFYSPPKYAEVLSKDRLPTPPVTNLKQGENDGQDDAPSFWSWLGGWTENIKCVLGGVSGICWRRAACSPLSSPMFPQSLPCNRSAEDGSVDDRLEFKMDKELMQLSDESGKMTFKQVATGDNIKRSLLNSKDVFIFNTGNAIFVWFVSEEGCDAHQTCTNLPTHIYTGSARTHRSRRRWPAWRTGSRILPPRRPRAWATCRRRWPRFPRVPRATFSTSTWAPDCRLWHSQSTTLCPDRQWPPTVACFSEPFTSASDLSLSIWICLCVCSCARNTQKQSSSFSRSFFLSLSLSIPTPLPLPIMLSLVVASAVMATAILAAVFWLFRPAPGSSSTRVGCTVPGPALPAGNAPLGHLPEIGAAGSLHQYLTRLHARYGSAASFMWGEQRVVTLTCAEWPCVQQLFDRPAVLFELFAPLIGRSSLQFKNADVARARRRIYSPCFRGVKLAALAHHLQASAQHLVDVWELAAAAGAAVDLHK